MLGGIVRSFKRGNSVLQGASNEHNTGEKLTVEQERKNPRSPEKYEFFLDVKKAGVMAKSLERSALDKLSIRRVAREGSLSQAVVEQLEKHIAAGQSPVGSKLPTESELCDAFGVSRTVVREAITHLKSKGMVETRRGVGTMVLRTEAVEPRPAVRISPTTVEDILQVLELRLILEPQAAELAAIRHEDADRKLIESRHNSFIQAQEKNSQARQEDFLFHFAIIKATHNLPFVQLYETLRDSMIPRAKLLSVDIDAYASQRYLKLVHEEHSLILNAIFSRDGSAARLAMHQHLERSRKMYAHYLSS